MRLYSDLVPWYRLLDPVADHEGEATVVLDAFRAAVGGGTLLELGAGAGNTAFFLRPYFTCTLTDLSPQMLGLSRGLNPDCEHLEGDLRTLRLGRTFDAVLLHDAVCYMATEADLRAAMATVFEHLRPGGVAVIAPDHFSEDFEEYAEVDEASDGPLALKSLAWCWDPDPSDTSYRVDYAFMVRRGSAMEVVHEHHIEGLFSRADWRLWAQRAGFTVESLFRPVDTEDPGEIFVLRRPG